MAMGLGVSWPLWTKQRWVLCKIKVFFSWSESSLVSSIQTRNSWITARTHVSTISPLKIRTNIKKACRPSLQTALRQSLKTLQKLKMILHSLCRSRQVPSTARHRRWLCLKCKKRSRNNISSLTLTKQLKLCRMKKAKKKMKQIWANLRKRTTSSNWKTIHPRRSARMP